MPGSTAVEKALQRMVPPRWNSWLSPSADAALSASRSVVVRGLARVFRGHFGRYGNQRVRMGDSNPLTGSTIKFKPPAFVRFVH